jgi:adenylate kinase family enzyme
MSSPSLPSLQIIGLTGLAGSGKDTVADILVSHLGFVKLAFADGLRHEIRQAFGVSPDTFTDRETKELPTNRLALKFCKKSEFILYLNSQKLLKTESKELLGHTGQVIAATGLYITEAEMLAYRSPRQIMQWWGTEYRRSQDPSYWLKSMGRAIANMSMFSNRIVITDTRFDNEAEFLKELSKSTDIQSNLQIWRIGGGGGAPIKAADSALSEHASEGGISSQYIDANIKNDHAIIDLIGPVLLHWLALESKQNLHTISSSRNHIQGWEYH